MENNELTQLWSEQKSALSDINAQQMINSSNKQRNKQLIGIIVMSITVMVLIIYAWTFFSSQWNNFNSGLLLMISSLVFRIALEFYYRWIKESKLVTLDYKKFNQYLINYYKARRWINYVITPLCFGLYCFGLTLLFPYFKTEFSNGFYQYLIVSGIGSLVIVAVIIIKGIVKENRFLTSLSESV